MTDIPEPGPLPWWQDAPSRRAARAERRRQRHEERAAKHEARHPAPPREPVTLERVGDAALQIVDAEGLDALTVRRLAQELGVGTMTLYWYVQNKDEILDLVADRIMADVTLPSPEANWQVGVREVATGVRASLLQHGNAVPVLLARGTLGPHGLGLIDSGIGLFRAAGFDQQGAADAYFAVANYVLGSCAAQVSSLSAPGRPDIPRPSYGEMLRDYIAGLPPGRYENLKAAAPQIFTGQSAERFAFGLDLIIEGLAQKLERAAAQATEK